MKQKATIILLFIFQLLCSKDACTTDRFNGKEIMAVKEDKCSYRESHQKYNSSPLFRYTFPELIESQRNSDSMIGRRDANYAALYFLRHVIETRYGAAKDYLIQKKRPCVNSYLEEACYTPHPAVINEVTREQTTSYVHSLIQFGNEHAQFVRKGKFLDEEGIVVRRENIETKGYCSGDTTSVMVWSKHTPEGRFTISVLGYTPMKIKEINNRKVSVNKPLESGSLRFIVFERENNKTTSTN